MTVQQRIAQLRERSEKLVANLSPLQRIALWSVLDDLFNVLEELANRDS